MSDKSIKKRGEDAACAYLERCGICVIERQWSCEAGKIDVVAWEGDALVLVEVKTGKPGKRVGHPLSDAGAPRIRRIAEAYLEYADVTDKSWRLDRIDLLVIRADRALLRHQRDALQATE